MTNAILRGKPNVENPHVAPTLRYGNTGRLGEGNGASVKPRRGSLLCKKTLALTVLLACGVHGAFAATFTWTGADGDYKWSNTNNWLKDSAATDTLPAAGDTVQLYPRRGETTDAHAIEVDVADVSVAKIVSGDADNAATTVTLTGEPITLTSDYPLDAYAPTVVSNAVTFARSGNMTVRCGKHIYLSGAVTLDCTMFLFYRGIGAKSGSLYVYGTVDGPNTTLGSGGDNMTCYLYNRIRLKALEAGRGSCCGNINLSGKGNDCPLGKVYYFGNLTADAAYAFPSNMVMTWNGDYTNSGNWEKFTFSTAQLVDRVSRPSPTCDASGGTRREVVYAD